MFFMGSSLVPLNYLRQSKSSAEAQKLITQSVVLAPERELVDEALPHSGHTKFLTR